MMETGIYVRVSTDEQAQEGFSIRAQTQKLKDYVRIKDWSLFKIYTDEGLSGKNITGRPAVQKLIEDVKSGYVKNVVVFKIDRLTRSTADLIFLVDLFNGCDCAFNSLMESIDTQTASGRMFLKIIGIFAEFERENIIERTKLGIERKVTARRAKSCSTLMMRKPKLFGTFLRCMYAEEQPSLKLPGGLIFAGLKQRLIKHGTAPKSGGYCKTVITSAMFGITLPIKCAQRNGTACMSRLSLRSSLTPPLKLWQTIK